MRARFLGKDPDSQVDNSPTLFTTDRTDRVTYIAQGWKVTNPQALADIGPVPDHETLIEIPEDVLKRTCAVTRSRMANADSSHSTRPGIPAALPLLRAHGLLAGSPRQLRRQLRERVAAQVPRG